MPSPHHRHRNNSVMNFFMTVVVLAVLLVTSTMLMITSVSAEVACDDKDDGSSCKNPDSAAMDAIIDPADDEESIPSFNYDKDGKDSNKAEITKSKDMAEYFSAYAELHHQKDMLEDIHRMDSYYNAIMTNAKGCFKDKIVLDVGTGSGILALWAAKAGAKKVYAIEYTDMAYNARQLIKDNGYEHIITVIQGTVESITLPLKEDGLLLSNDNNDNDGNDVDEHVIDVIVSEWMGYMLLRESMLDSVLIARDKYLKPSTGLMFPSHATIYLAPITDESQRLDNINNYKDSIDDWYDFVERTQTSYGIDYDTLTEKYNQEQLDYYIYHSHWKEYQQSNDNDDGNNGSDDVLILPQEDSQIIKQLDLITCTLQDTRGILGVSNPVNGNYEDNVFDFVIDPKINSRPISGFLSWFTTDFKSRTDSMISNETPKLKTPYVTLNTGPNQIPSTHWGQQAFYFKNSIRPKMDLKKAALLAGTTKPDNNNSGDDKELLTVHLKGKIELVRTKNNKRLYNVRIEHHIEEISGKNDVITRQTDSIEATYKIA